ncbi:hypothetical protein ACGFOU_34900 [Streptomyces sp. NPDC048595]|uniref:hypothetical protein n=1 Tax=Streptomyces sp. NPDC048595 TaxID=3365576 RepID=UPI003712535E
MMEAVLAGLGGLPQVYSVLGSEGVGTDLDDQVADHCAQGLLDGRQGDADDLFSDLLAHLLEEALDDYTGRLGRGQSSDLGETQSERCRRLRGDYFCGEDAQLDDRADLCALDEDRHTVHGSGRHAAALPQILEVSAIDLAPVSVERLDSQRATR